MRQNITMDRSAKKPSTGPQPGERDRKDDDREATATGDDDLADDELDELDEEEDIEDEGEDDV